MVMGNIDDEIVHDLAFVDWMIEEGGIQIWFICLSQNDLENGAAKRNREIQMDTCRWKDKEVSNDNIDFKVSNAIQIEIPEGR